MDDVQFVPHGVYQDDLMDEGVKGEWHATGRGPLSIPNGETARFLISNPAGSGKLILIHRYRVHATTTSEYVSILVNPTTNLPTTSVPASNRYIGKPVGVAQVKVDSGLPMSGGTTLPYQIPIEVGGATYTEFIIHPSIIVPPGFSIGTNFSNNSGGPSLYSTLLDWREVVEK